MPEPVKLSSRLQALFAKTKLVCFGRYALLVPEEAQLIVGTVGVPYDVKVISGGIAASEVRVATDIAKIKSEEKSAEIKYTGKGPIEASWQIRYYQDESHKRRGAVYFQTYVNKGDLTFIIEDAVGGKNDNEEAAAARQRFLANSLRQRSADEVPNEAGFCVNHAFVPEKMYAEQETASAGIYLPTLPDGPNVVLSGS